MWLILFVCFNPKYKKERKIDALEKYNHVFVWLFFPWRWRRPAAAPWLPRARTASAWPARRLFLWSVAVLFHVLFQLYLLFFFSPLCLEDYRNTLHVCHTTPAPYVVSIVHCLVCVCLRCRTSPTWTGWCSKDGKRWWRAAVPAPRPQITTKWMVWSPRGPYWSSAAQDQQFQMRKRGRKHCNYLEFWKKLDLNFDWSSNKVSVKFK